MNSAVVSPRGLLVAIALGTTLAPINSTMIAVALPQIQADLDVSITDTAWLVTIYLAAMVIGQPIGGLLGDLHGRRLVYLGGLALFGIASIGCSLAPGFEVLVLFRVLQALSGAMSFPNGAAMIRESYPATGRGAAFGMIGLATGVAAAAGPPIGGLLVHAFDWRAIFWVNVPIIGLALPLGLKYLPRTRSRSAESKGFDVAGALLLTISLAAIVTVPTLVRTDNEFLAAIAIGFAFVSGIAFVGWELRVPVPVVDLRLFGERAFAAACSSIFLSNLVMYTTLLAIPVLLVRVRGYDDRAAGLTLAALSIFAGLWGPVGGRVTDRHGRWLPAVAGAILLFIGALCLAAVAGGEQLWTLALALGFMGLGLGISGAPVQTAAIEAAPLSRVGSAAGVFSTSRYMGSVVGSTLLALLFLQEPGRGETAPFTMLFGALSVVALVCIAANSKIEERWQPRG